MAQDTRAEAGNSLPKQWVSFPGGELEGERPVVRCRDCRTRARSGKPADAGTLCFQCYRAGLDRERALAAAAELDTATDARFQSQLPFEPVDVARLNRLKTARADTRATAATIIDARARFDAARRKAQIAARRAVDAAAASASEANRRRALADAIHAAELQLPEAWLPFVVAR